jgi:hypothetical protein
MSVGISGWLVDSGASDHVTFDRNDFVDFREVDEYLVWGSDLRCKVTGRGKVIVETCLGGRSERFILNDVLLVPDFKCKIYSFGRGCARGWKFVGGKKCITGSLNGEVLIIAERVKEGFFVADFKVVGNDNSVNVDRVCSKRGGSANDRYVPIVEKKEIIESKNIVVNSGNRNSNAGIDVREGAYIGVMSDDVTGNSVSKVFVHQGVQVSENSLGFLRGGGSSRQDCRIGKEQFEDDLKKVYNSILEVVAEVELEKDVSEGNDSKYSIDWDQMFGSKFNKNLVQASSAKHGVCKREVDKCKSVLKGVEQRRNVESGCSGFADWDAIEVLGDNSGGVKACVLNDECDSGDEGLSFRHRIRRGRRICERGKGVIIEV